MAAPITTNSSIANEMRHRGALNSFPERATSLRSLTKMAPSVFLLINMAAPCLCLSKMAAPRNSLQRTHGAWPAGGAHPHFVPTSWRPPFPYNVAQDGGAHASGCHVFNSEHGAARRARPFLTWRRPLPPPPRRTEPALRSHMGPARPGTSCPKMAAAALGLILRLAPRLAANPRNLHVGVASPAGGLWRVQQGLAPSSGGYGPLRDLPDWSFVDGRPAPPWKGQTRRRQEDAAFARRVAQLAGEMERGLQRWRDGRCRELDAQDSRRQNRLQPKGGALRRDRAPH